MHKHRFALVSLPALLLALTLAGCISDTDRVTGTLAFAGSGTSGGAGPGTVDPALVGRWSRTTFLDDNSGILHSSQLIWEFNADGGARRIIITTNLTLGAVSTETIPALWRANAGVVDITFLPPGGGSQRYQYTARASQLILGPSVLERTP
jgi:hypothetical protein